jgi:DNA-binding PadR family transcriptional regulator
MRFGKRETSWISSRPVGISKRIYHKTITTRLSFELALVISHLPPETSQRLETLPSLAETIVLDVIDSYQPVSGYQIRKRFMETTKKRLSFGTLVPMLHRFEKSGMVMRTRESGDDTSYNWFLTPYGSTQLESRLALLSKMLRASAGRKEALSTRWEVERETPRLASLSEFSW